MLQISFFEIAHVSLKSLKAKQEEGEGEQISGLSKLLVVKRLWSCSTSFLIRSSLIISLLFSFIPVRQNTNLFKVFAFKSHLTFSFWSWPAFVNLKVFRNEKIRAKEIKQKKKKKNERSKRTALNQSSRRFQLPAVLSACEKYQNVNLSVWVGDKANQLCNN